MRLFKKGITRAPLSSTSAAEKESRRQSYSGSIRRSSNEDSLSTSFANLFSERNDDKYIDSSKLQAQLPVSDVPPGSAIPRTKSMLKIVTSFATSPKVSDNDRGSSNPSPSDTKSPQAAKNDTESNNRILFASPVSMIDSQPNFSSSADLRGPTSSRIDSIADEPKANRNSPRPSKRVNIFEESKSNRKSREITDERFEEADVDDELFMLEEATRRDFKRGEDVAADLETATVLFKRKNGQSKEDIDMSAEEILRTQRWGRSCKKLSASPTRKRPPPLMKGLVLPTESPSAAYSNVFGRDGGFVTDGFKITSEGMVNKPDIDLREDEVQTMRGADQLLGFHMKSLSEFRKGPTIGAGAAGRVYIALHQPSSLAVAMKTVNVFDKALRSQLMKELVTLSRHVSRYLVRFYGAFYDGSGAVHIALEFMDRGCLASFVKKNGPIPERIVRIIAKDCMRGLRFLHKYHVLHRDFKTANILMSREQCCAKISDFGLARDMNPGVSKVNTFVGTVAYMSPERLQGSEYTYASDIWALGVSLCECLMGRYPFDNPTNYFDYIDATMTNNLFDTGNEEMGRVSETARSFIMLCTDADPKKRPTAEELLNHSWLKGFRPDRSMFGAWMDEVSGKETPKILE